MSIFLPETLIPEEMLEEIARTHRLVLLSNTNSDPFRRSTGELPPAQAFPRVRFVVRGGRDEALAADLRESHRSGGLRGE